MEKKISKSKIIILLSTILVCVVSFYIYLKYQEENPETEDAYIKAHLIYVAAQVSGKVKNIYIKENQKVEKGKLLFEIEEKPYQIKVNEAKLNINIIKNNIVLGKAEIKTMNSSVQKSLSAYNLAKLHTKRILDLYKTKNVSTEEKDQAVANLEEAKSVYEMTKSQLEEAKIKVETLKENLKLSYEELKQAELELSWCKIYATENGFIANFDLQKGSMVNIGQSLFVLISNNSWWIKANYKETQLGNIQIGDKVSIYVDMYPNIEFLGTVQSISYGSGAIFSLLPAQNATGNWVKVTQRFPVKISIDNYNGKPQLRVGSSVNVRVKN